MANFNAVFAGCESFMEGDVEINNDVTVPASDGEALEAETVAEDVGAEGGEIAGEAETTDAKAEAANMVFDQVLNMYQHVKNNGIDRTFLSLYNRQGQLNNMIGYSFPSCESMDSVGSPRSSASRAFIAAMESDGIFTKIWNWIKEQWAKLVNFFRKVMDWFREACGNLDLRVGKLLKYFNNSTDKKPEDVKDKSVKYFANAEIDQYTKAITAVNAELKNLGQRSFAAGRTTSGQGLYGAVQMCSGMVEYISDNFKSIAGSVRDRAGEGGTYGRAKDSDDKNGHKQLKQYIDRFSKDAIKPLDEAISDLGKESDDLSKIGTKGSIAVTIAVGTSALTKTGTVETSGTASGVKPAMVDMLKSCAEYLKEILKQKQTFEIMDRANKMADQSAEQAARLATGESRGYDATKDAKEETLAAVKFNSVFAKIIGLEEKLVAKCCKVAASYTSCVSANGANANP